MKTNPKKEINKKNKEQKHEKNRNSKKKVKIENK